MWCHVLSARYAAQVQVLFQFQALEAQMAREQHRLFVVDNNIAVLAHAVNFHSVPLAHGQWLLGFDDDRLLAQVHAKLNIALVQGERHKVAAASSLAVVQKDAVLPFWFEGDLEIELVQHILHLREAHVAVGCLREVGNRAGYNQDGWNVDRGSVVGGAADICASITGLHLDQTKLALEG